MEKQKSQVPIFGFTILRNAVKFDYPFRESLGSLGPLCEKVYLALGEGEDTTEAEVRKIPGLEIFNTVWEPSLRTGGLILSQQTNLILGKLREARKDSQHPGWGIYLQADEVLHEQDFEKIKMDIQKADELGCDVVRFRYFHFWQSHHHIAINKKWYPQEIRAVKLDSKVESWGDAQSFRGHQKIFESDATIYHYGHVREEESYKQKTTSFLKMYTGDLGFKEYQEKMQKKDAFTEVLKFWGKHPKIMHTRIKDLGEEPVASKRKRLAVLTSNFSSEKRSEGRDEVLGLKPNVESLVLAKSTSELKGFSKDEIVVANPNWLEKVRFRQKTPSKMRSKLAREWPAETKLMLRLSEKGFGVI